MTDIETLVKVVQQIHSILSDHIEPEFSSDRDGTIDRIFTVMDQYSAIQAADRINAGYGLLRVVK
jgi:hypothetical protein